MTKNLKRNRERLKENKRNKERKKWKIKERKEE